MPRRRRASISETRLIADLRRRFRTPRGRPGALALGIGDDCALLRPRAGAEVAVTTDLFLEGRHFRRDTHTALSAGHRCLARGLSDLAAMGATPLAAFLSLALPRETGSTKDGRRWLESFLDGLHALARAANVPLAGGDTAEAPDSSLIADIVLLGEVPQGKALRRSGAQPGDLLYVSGALGGSAAELETLFRRSAAGRAPGPNPSGAALARHPQSFPQPRLALGQALRRRGGVSACLDISDGLSTDLAHLCDESRVRAVVLAAGLPLSPLLAQHVRPLDLALHGGEDYELLFTAAPTARMPHRLAGVPLSCIGRIERASDRHPQVSILSPDGSEFPLTPGGWEHLAGPARS